MLGVKVGMWVGAKVGSDVVKRVGRAVVGNIVDIFDGSRDGVSVRFVT